MRIPNNPVPLTEAQYKYIEVLLNDVGMWEGRKDSLKRRFNVEHVSDLNKTQASAFITELKELKERQKSGIHHEIPETHGEL